MKLTINFFAVICTMINFSLYSQVDSSGFIKDSLTSEAGWDLKMFEQDIETYKKYKQELVCYPLTLSAFPVKEYEYAVHSQSAQFYLNGHTYVKISIGDYPDFDSDSTRIAGSLIFQVDSLSTNENTFVQSRNWPYLTAQGTVKVDKFPFDWIFIETPEHYGYFMVNMKLFDLKDGRNVYIFPNEDGSFTYSQKR